MTESSRLTDASLARALSLARDALSDAPAGLLADFDGTISPIVADPGLARLVDGAHGALAALIDRLAVVAIITGRSPLDARRMAGVPGLLIAGNHGTEWLEPDAAGATLSPEASSVRGRLDAVLARLPQLPGALLEHKGLSASVHYRQTPDPDAALRAILEALGDVRAYGLEIRHGRMIVELRPMGLGDKGVAARMIIDRFGLRGVVVLGDDLTDLDMFRAVAELREAGRLRAVIIGVGGVDHEVPPEVVDGADVLLSHPAEAARFLEALGKVISPADDERIPQ